MDLYDSTHGKFDGSVETNDDSLVVNSEVIHVFAARSPSPVIQRRRHKVVNSEPPKDSTPMYMMGVNHKKYDGSAPVVWNASCFGGGTGGLGGAGGLSGVDFRSRPVKSASIVKNHCASRASRKRPCGAPHEHDDQHGWWSLLPVADAAAAKQAQ
ncbi:hypothetical protein PHYSODRAFT_334149 [Phytophthora sojae]|uniref:Glyceraldehyde 3-phosphate dehydrogenase NAD(P) binding domain-containing protein n=1 Tax=Phytophthora sojae (strain P6497) TaxID=1094619 RepID=G4ZLA6_PHYSP|nr:hypothetical protein PHYSODRAFT_334149 [Phytophthora sojae]EGZ15952.1 hypothetical protein PHYSODRAFT_334149 [Phytophthora sojae]|eukprot:XP_009529701.1 hypothetical protein PHYSODRAFT_334149 [Phytophthora sojae]